LRTLINGDKYSDIHFGLKLSAGNIGHADKVYTLPYFCTFLLKRYLQEMSFDRENECC